MGRVERSRREHGETDPRRDIVALTADDATSLRNAAGTGRAGAPSGMRGDAVTLGDLVGKITMLDVACRRCERRGRLRLDRLIEQHGDMRLPELRLILAG